MNLRALLRRAAPVALAVLAVTVPFAAAAHAAPGYPSNSEKSKPAGAKVTGNATYRERIALTPDAVFEATLYDVSRADAAAVVIGRKRIENPGQVPIRFEIPYDTRRIVEKNTYVVRATIHDRDRLAFTTVSEHPVLTHDHPGTVDLVLRGVSAPKDPDRGGDGRPAPVLGPLPAMFTGMLPCADCMGIQYQLNVLKDGAYMQRTTYLRSGHDASYYEIGRWELSTDLRTLVLSGGRDGSTYWSLEDANTLRKLDREGRPIESKLRYELKRAANVTSIGARVRLRGTFRYASGDGRFRDCVSGLAWPVTMGEDYLALERAYDRDRAKPGAELPVLIDGRIVQRRKTEGEGTEPALVVEKFVRSVPNEPCEPAGVQNELANTRWVPTHVNGKAVVVQKNQREAWIVFEPKELRVTGSGGCNRISGGYRAASGGRLTLEKVASTMMACPDMAGEQAFLKALEKTTRFRIAGRQLELFDAGGRTVMRLEERNL